MSCSPTPQPFQGPGTCGGVALVSWGYSFLAAISLVFSIAQGIGQGFTTIQKILKEVPGGSSGAIILATILAASIIIIWLWGNYITLTQSPPVGTFACISGVVNSIVPPVLNPLNFSWGFVFVVVKHAYWHVVTDNNPPFIWCSACTNCPSGVWPPGTTSQDASIVTCSPMLPCFYHSQEVANAALGASIGGTIGAVGGAILGSVLGIAAMGTTDCAFAGPFALICWIVLALVVLVAVLITAFCAAVGDIAGTVIGQSTANDTSPTGDLQGTQKLVQVTIGAYVSIIGNVVKVAAVNSSNAIYFAGWITGTNTVVDQTQINGNGTTIMGNSMNAPDFCFTDPDCNIPDDMKHDPCWKK